MGRFPQLADFSSAIMLCHTSEKYKFRSFQAKTTWYCVLARNVVNQAESVGYVLLAIGFILAFISIVLVI